MASCLKCSGTGMVSVSSICRKCNGTAEITTYDRDGNEELQLCPNCEDGLTYREQTCSACKGTGES